MSLSDVEEEGSGYRVPQGFAHNSDARMCFVGMSSENPSSSDRHADGQPSEADRRRSRRREAFGTFVAIEAPSVSRDFCWSGTLIDINGDGMALTLPPAMYPGVKVRLTVGLGPNAYLERVPAVIIRLKEGVGAVRFETWQEEDRLKLLSYLLDED